jgi:glycosyltransferase involved in cell wall biosynthesis
MQGGESPILCFAGQDWWYHNRAHSDFQLMLRIAGGRDVLLVNSIGMRAPLPGRSTQFLRRIARKARSMARRLRQPVAELPRFHVFTPVVLPFYGSPTARHWNAVLVAAQVRAALRRLRLADPIAVVTVPTAWDVLAHIPHRRLVWNRSDKYSEFGETDQETIRGLERALLTHADAVVYVSHALLDEERAHTGARARFLDHGVDLDHFRRRPPAEEPDDLRAIPHPRIGFFGGIDDYVIDFEILERLAQRIPEAQLVLVGDATCSMQRFARYPNAHWLGFRPYAEIPRYGSGFDVAIMPWLRNEWIRACNPIKLKEYLALGLPVVSTDFPELRRYRDLVRIAADADEFVELVRRSLAAGGPAAPDQLRARVLGSSWDRVAAELLAICDGAEEERACAGS